MLWDTWTLTILFFFSFIFLLDNEEVCDTAVTWCDIIGLELLQTQALRVGQVKKPCIGLIQENSIENFVQDSLPYIPWTHGPC